MRLYLHNSAGCSSPRNSPRLRRVGAPRQRQRTPRTQPGSRGERGDHPKIGLYNLGVRAAQGATCARPRVWPENEERALAGEAQPHRFVARSLQTLHERVVAEEVAHQEGKITENSSTLNSFMSDLAGVPEAAPQTRPRRVPFSFISTWTVSS